MNLSDLSLRDIEAVVAVADSRHFGRAAESLRVAQPTLSAQVRKVERLLGVEVFERTGRSFLVTPEGERLLPLMRDLLTRARSMADEARAREGAEAAPLRVGVIPTLGPYVVPHVLGRGRRGPALAISEHTTGILLQRLREGAIDVAMISLPAAHETLETLTLFDEPFALVMPRGHALARAARLGPSMLSASEMVLLEEGHCLRDQSLALCNRRGGSSPRLVTTSLETLKYLVAAGEGYSLLPLLSTRLSSELAALVEVRRFDEGAPSRRIVLCSRSTSARGAEIAGLGAWIADRVRPVLAEFAARADRATARRRRAT